MFCYVQITVLTLEFFKTLKKVNPLGNAKQKMKPLENGKEISVLRCDFCHVHGYLRAITEANHHFVYALHCEAWTVEVTNGTLNKNYSTIYAFTISP